MNDTSLTQKVWTYIAESLRLFYWAFFKPFTLERQLHDIHPKLQNLASRSLLSEFAINPHLHRYAGQILWLIAVIPLPVTILVGVMYSLVTDDAFNWFSSGFFLLGWLGAVGGGWLVWVFPEQRRRLLLFFIPTILITALFMLLLTNDMPAIVPTFLEAPRLIGIGIGIGIGVGIGIGISFGITEGIG